MTPTPVKPFPSYKWHWLSFQPTEGLLDPPVFLGVLRVYARFDGTNTTDTRIAAGLRIVEEETRTRVDLVRERDPKRPLIRNAGQYWKGTGLLEPTDGKIELTPLGRRVASGDVTQSEFAAIMVQQTALANPLTYSAAEMAEWENAGLRIKPLELILNILENLGHGTGGLPEAYLTPTELVKICIPLAGAKASAITIAQAIIEHRRGILSVSGWPNCAPGANDPRMAKEFLRFLSNFGLCRRVPRTAKSDERFYIDELYDVSASIAVASASIFADPSETNAIIDEVQHSVLPSIIDRQRRIAMVKARPGQAKFRESIMRAYKGRCAVTGDYIENILEAAHIIPAKNGGGDGQENGLCLRVDIHRLFDSFNIRLRQDGQLHLSDVVRQSPNYDFLPARIVLPAFVNPVNVHWRDTYL